MNIIDFVLKEAGMIKVDGGAVDNILEKFKDWVKSHDLDEIADDVFYEVDTVNDVHVMIEPQTNGLEGGYAKLKGMQIVKVFYKKYKYKHLLEPLTIKEIRKILLHEITHAIDKRYTGIEDKPINIKKWKSDDWKEYFNDPEEVRAHMRQIYEEIKYTVVERMRGKLKKIWGLNKIITVELSQNDTWQGMKKFINDKNRRIVLLGITKEITNLINRLKI